RDHQLSQVARSRAGEREARQVSRIPRRARVHRRRVLFQAGKISRGARSLRGNRAQIQRHADRAALAYEALIQHYPQSQYAAQAKTQMALVEKEKHDPLALLLMRDRRPSGAATPEVKEDPALAKLKDLNLVAKTEVVHEEPSEEKSFLSRVATKLNPFSPSDNDKKAEEKKEPTATELLARRQAQKKEESGGILASLWPFGSSAKEPAAKPDAKPGF